MRHELLDNRAKWVGIVALALAAGLYRVASGMWWTDLPNFSPAMAMAFCCGMALPGVLGFALPIAILFASDLVLNFHYHMPLVSISMAGVYACYLIAATAGGYLRRSGFLALAGATLANSLLFYVVTNSLAWIGNANYPQTTAGWVQALTVGQPGFPPTWVFFRNSLLSDALFTVLFVIVVLRMQRPSAAFKPAVA